MIKWFAKKYLIKTINSLMEDYKTDIAGVCEKTDVWITRLEKILAQLKSVKTKVADGELTQEEADTVIEELETLVKEF